jgi:hypothetical protein
LLRELDHLDGVCRSRQLGLIVAVIPDKEQLGAGPSVLGFQQRIDHWCHDVGVRCLDALPYFETHGAASNYFAWDAHLSEEGHRAWRANSVAVRASYSQRSAAMGSTRVARRAGR